MTDQSNADFLQTWKKVANEPSVSEVSAFESPLSSEKPNVTSRPWWKKRGLWIGVGVFVFLLLSLAGAGAAVGYTVYQQAQAIQYDADLAMNEGRAMYASFKGQNLPEAKQHLLTAQQHILDAQQKYQKLAWAGKLPYASKYYEDGTQGFIAALAGTNAGLKAFDAIEPHADLLGFKGEGTFQGNTQDRIALVLETLNALNPALDGIAADIHTMQTSLATIDPADYPEEVKGKPLRSYLTQAKSAAIAAEVALNEARPAVERLPEIAGADGRKKYLVVFQNDNELRPTGGFMTAYAVVFVENGQVTAEKSDDIYELDKKFRNKPPIPAELGRFLTTEKTWNLRDMNIDPNFKNSMKTFFSYYDQLPGEPDNIDGIIAIDTNVLTKIVDVLGPIEIPGYGTFSSQTVERCDCPQIIYALSEIIDRPTPYIRENRKGILAPLMQSIIQKTYATQRDKWPQLAQVLWTGIEGRHVQFYFMNEEDQKAAESIRAAGIIPNIPEESDYLTVVDANLGGAKSNLFVETSGMQTISAPVDGRIKKEVELTYRNTHPASNCNLEAGQLCLNSRLNNWTRWYVPKGVQLESVVGLEEGYKLDTTYPGYDIIEGIFKLDPMGQTKVRVTYTVPYTNASEYKLLIQKQAGTDAIPYEITLPNGTVNEVVLDRDRELSVTW